MKQEEAHGTVPQRQYTMFSGKIKMLKSNNG